MLCIYRSFGLVVTLVFALPILCNHALASSAELPSMFKVALVDKFYPGDDAFVSTEERELDTALYGMLDIDGDSRKEPIYHGDVVSAILTHPLIDIVPYKLKRDETSIAGLLRNLQDIRQALFWGDQIDAIVLPWESSTLLSAFNPQSLNEIDVPQYLDTLRQWGNQDETWSTTWDIILVLEDIIELGGQVYTIAGNGGPRMVNTYSFATGIITVGANEPELQHFVSDNKLVDMHEQAAYLAERVDGPQGEVIGYDISGNGCSDVSIHVLTSEGTVSLPKRYWKALKGSSFAAPMAVKKDLVGEVGSTYCL